MEKRSRSEAEIELPEAMIQHIQAFLGGKEAAKTTVLSKSWYSAWLTRPNLTFDQSDFDPKSRVFHKLLKKTLQRYKDLNLKINSFNLRMKSLRSAGHALANELIVDAITMGALDIIFKIARPSSNFVLPPQVLHSNRLVRLSVKGCKIRDCAFRVKCLKLKYLYLIQVVVDANLIWDVILSCPLIECLVLGGCKVENDDIPAKKRPLSLSEHYFWLNKLKKLFLEKVEICSRFFIGLSFRFPCLKDLSVHDCFGFKEIYICSESLEFISFKQSRRLLKAEFAVPNLRKFCFSSERCLPCLSFPNSSNWESDIAIYECYIFSARWFFKLNKLLTALSQSKVSFFVRNLYFSGICNAVSINRRLSKPLVEYFTIGALCLEWPILFDSLFHFCRPVYLTQHWHPENSLVDGKRGIECLEFVYNRVMMQHSLFCEDGFEVVSVAIFDDAVPVWRILPWKTLLDVATSLTGYQSIRFHLGWGRESAAHK